MLKLLTVSFVINKSRTPLQSKREVVGLVMKAASKRFRLVNQQVIRKALWFIFEHFSWCWIRGIDEYWFGLEFNLFSKPVLKLDQSWDFSSLKLRSVRLWVQTSFNFSTHGKLKCLGLFNTRGYTINWNRDAEPEIRFCTHLNGLLVTRQIASRDFPLKYNNQQQKPQIFRNVSPDIGCATAQEL